MLLTQQEHYIIKFLAKPGRIFVSKIEAWFYACTHFYLHIIPFHLHIVSLYLHIICFISL